MARPLRIEYDGALYHVTSRGNERRAAFRDDTDRELFLNTLAQVEQFRCDGRSDASAPVSIDARPFPGRPLV
jgi:hypothetical protein